MMADNPVVHLVDDDPSIRTSLARLLRVAGYETETHASAAEFLARGADSRGGCLVLDLHMPDGLNGLELQETLTGRPDALPIVFLTGYGDVGATVRAMKRGAVDFLTKPASKTELLAAVARALERNVQMRRNRQEHAELSARLKRLTPREREVFEMVVSGMLNKQIAKKLGTTERTVKAHRAQVMRKLAANSLAELVQMAARLEIGR